MSDATQFEAECRALYERHKVVGFFTYMAEGDASVRGQLRASKDDREGLLVGAKGLAERLLERLRQTRPRSA